MHCLAYDVEQDYSDILRPYVGLKFVFMAFFGSNTHYLLKHLLKQRYVQ